MRTFLALSMLLFVSGEQDQTINGTVGESVLLPCTCPGLDLSLKWQKHEPEMALVVIYNGTKVESHGSYKGRAHTFVAEKRSNCSLLLTNITADDQGTYKCIFYMLGRYTSYPIELNIFEKYVIGNATQSKTDQGHIQRQHFLLCFIPIMSVIGFSLVLWRCWKHSLWKKLKLTTTEDTRHFRLKHEQS